MNQSLKAALLLTGLIALTALGAGRVRPALAQFAPAAGQQSQTFQCIQAVAPLFTVPAGVTRITVEAHGAQGASGIGPAPGGQGGLTIATLPVTPGQQLQVSVGCSGQHGSWGYGNGGRGGFPRGGAGGGSSAVTPPNSGRALVVAGGGGGNGGNGGGGQPGGNGGNGGSPARNGQHGSGGAGGGRGGHQSGPNATNGTNASFGEDGGGGGGGGGFHGGDGGHAGSSGGSGGGGGGGSSFVTSSATGVTFGTSQRPGDGLVVLRWTPALTVTGVSRRHPTAPAPVQPRCSRWSGPLALIIPWQNCTG